MKVLTKALREEVLCDGIRCEAVLRVPLDDDGYTYEDAEDVGWFFGSPDEGDYCPKCKTVDGEQP